MGARFIGGTSGNLLGIASICPFASLSSSLKNISVVVNVEHVVFMCCAVVSMLEFTYWSISASDGVCGSSSSAVEL
ncbi:unnamed protein product [Haemonchus placei]|uniref:Secreted protein n=1 Tax=Haemonchus placei TaxID=6290 RepID=A0A0N4X8W5_HAEPC|nr:unnamed protein product [Haemonchus placei]